MKRLRHRWRIISKLILEKKNSVKGGNDLNWLRIGSGGRLL
jgi:hypothetical protein